MGEASKVWINARIRRRWKIFRFLDMAIWWLLTTDNLAVTAGQLKWRAIKEDSSATNWTLTGGEYEKRQLRRYIRNYEKTFAKLFKPLRYYQSLLFRFWCEGIILSGLTCLEMSHAALLFV